MKNRRDGSQVGKRDFFFFLSSFDRVQGVNKGKKRVGGAQGRKVRFDWGVWVTERVVTECVVTEGMLKGRGVTIK